SVKVENPDGKMIAGIANYMPSTAKFTVQKGFDFAVLNCTNKGENVQLAPSKNTNFRLMIAPGNYPEGLKISICDSQRGAMFVTTEPLNLSAGDVHTIEKEYACEDDLAFYEGFDNFVWGGDIMKGSEGYGFSPSADKMGIDSGTELTGYEDAFAEVAYDNAGSGFIQPNVWDQVTGKTVGEAHQMSESYVKSRNMANWTYAYRVQEFPGYIGSGVASNGRGMINLPQALCAKGIGDVVMKFRFALQANFVGGLEFSISYGGVIKAAKINGHEIELTNSMHEYRSETSKLKLVPDGNFFTTSSAAAGNKWNELEVTISGATSGTKLNFQNSEMSGGNLGLFVDAVEFRKVKDWKEGSNLRVLYWNVQNGVCSDQHNNYDNFVKFVKKWDPDVCIWCESETIYKDKSGTGTSTKYLPDGWAQLCTRYGHVYAAVGGNRDNYPQTITSKYPIKTIKKITDTNVSGKPVSHGAGHFQIEVHGKKINFVTLHMWPQLYNYGVSGTAAREESAAKNEGDYYRQHEMQYIVDQTVNLAANASEEYWIFGGDTNSNSRLDDWNTKYSTSTRPTRLITHDVVLNQTNLKDVISSRDCYGEKGNVMFRSRIDILYASPKMFDCITNSIMLMDDWADTMDPWEWHREFRDPSDHTPVLVDFKL
ncbi:MAG: metal-dependent hydrolase, partial [Alistipes sp.]|nr:metal-dependent hydrolase [Alistipes sp.]